MQAWPSCSVPELIVLQKWDPDTGEALKFWQRLNLYLSWWLCFSGNVIGLCSESILYHRVFHLDGGEVVLQLVLPVTLQSEVFTQLHEHCGHQGTERTLELVRQQCY